MRRAALSAVVLTAGAGLLVAAAFAVAERTGVRKGGTFRVGLEGDGGAIDPTLGFAPHTNITCAKLFNFPDRPGIRIVPEAAAGYPKLSRDGKVYTFTVRKGFRFNTGEQLTARNFAWAINRTLIMHGLGDQYIREIVGGEAVLDGKAKTASGVNARGNRLTIRLKERVPDFPLRMAHSSFCAIPANLPIDPEGVGAPIPSAGPYYVSEWVRGRQLVLSRNKRYGGKRRHRVDQFVFTFGEDPETIKRKIEQGQLETGDIPPTAHRELGQRYGVNRSQYHVRPTQFAFYLVFNVERRLFRSARLRKAVNFAVDRSAIVKAGEQLSGDRTFGSYWGTASDRSLPPSLGGVLARVYPLGRPDLRRARALAKGLRKGAQATLYTRNVEPWGSWAQLIQRNLRQIGIAVRIEAFPPRVQIGKLQDPRREPWDLGLIAFGPDLPDPFYTLNYLLDVPGEYFFRKYPGHIRALRKAARLTGDARYRAYGKLALSLVRDVAPSAVLAKVNRRTFVSKRVGCKVFYPELDLAVACLKR